MGGDLENSEILGERRILILREMGSVFDPGERPHFAGNTEIGSLRGAAEVRIDNQYPVPVQGAGGGKVRHKKGLSFLGQGARDHNGLGDLLDAMDLQTGVDGAVDFGDGFVLLIDNESSFERLLLALDSLDVGKEGFPDRLLHVGGRFQAGIEKLNGDGTPTMPMRNRMAVTAKIFVPVGRERTPGRFRLVEDTDIGIIQLARNVCFVQAGHHVVEGAAITLQFSAQGRCSRWPWSRGGGLRFRLGQAGW